MKIRDIISEVASVGATSAANIATVASPHIAVGPDRFKKSYTGTPGKSGVASPHIAVGPDRFKKSYTGTPGKSGTKAPRLPKVVQPKKKDGTAKGAHALPGVSIFGGPLKR